MSGNALAQVIDVGKAVGKIIRLEGTNRQTVRNTDIQTATERAGETRDFTVVGRASRLQIYAVPGDSHESMTEDIEAAKLSNVDLWSSQEAVIARVHRQKVHVRRSSVSRKIEHEPQTL